MNQIGRSNLDLFQHRKDQFVENEGNKREQNHFKPVPGRQNKAGTIVADKL